MFDLLGPIIGGLLGSDEQEQSRTTQNQMDPDMRRYVFGEDGRGGLLGRLTERYNANPSGINQQMLDGWNRQYGLLTDPSVQAGYQHMRGTGNALMSSPIAGNPFTREGGYSRSMFGGGGQMQGGMQGPPAPMQQAPQPAGQFGPAPSYNPSQPGMSQARDLYAQIGRTGQNAPSQQELDFWAGTGLQGNALTQRFLGDAAGYAGPGFDANKQRAQGLLAARQPAFSMPQAPTPAAPAPAPAQQQYNPNQPGSQYGSEQALADWLRQQSTYGVG